MSILPPAAAIKDAAASEEGRETIHRNIKTYITGEEEEMRLEALGKRLIKLLEEEKQDLVAICEVLVRSWK